MRADDEQAKGRWHRAVRLAGAGLVLYGLATILLQFEVLIKIAHAISGYASWVSAGLAGLPTAAPDPTFLDDFQRSLYAVATLRQPLMPWLAATAGVVLLLVTQQGSAEPGSRRRRWALLGWLSLAGLVLALLAGGWLRAANLLPVNGILPGSNFDEMVYYTQSKLATHGALPYRDTFMAHPPGVVWAFAPGLALEQSWGGLGAFVAARQWLFVYSLLAVLLIWLCGRMLGGPLSGAIAAIVLALDGKAAFAPESERHLPNVGVLETLVNLASAAALAVYLYAPADGPRRKWWLIASGALAGVAAMCKIPGVALIGALLLFSLAMRRWGETVLLGFGAVVGAGVIALPFFAAAPGQMVRQAVFFQLLRPQEVREGVDQAARIATYPEAQVTLLLAGLGVLVVGGLLIWRKSGCPATWVLPLLWAAPVAAVFALGRSYHSQYYTQWVPPLALLAGAIATRQLANFSILARSASALAVTLVLIPMVTSQWQAAASSSPDPTYQTAGALLAAVTKPGQQAMAFDPGYTLLAGLPPAQIPPDGDYLVDTAGFTVYTAEEMDRAPWGDLLSRAISGGRVRNEPDVLQRPEGQAALLAGAIGANTVALDQKIGIPKLTAQSVWLLRGLASTQEDAGYATILGIKQAGRGQPQLLNLGLTASMLSVLGSDASPQVDQGTVEASAAQAVQLALYWRPTASLPGNYHVVVRIVGTGGQTARQEDTEPAEGSQHTSTWRPGFVYPDLRNVPLQGIGQGSYTLFVRVYDAANGASSPEVELGPRLTIR